MEDTIRAGLNLALDIIDAELRYINSDKWEKANEDLGIAKGLCRIHGKGSLLQVKGELVQCIRAEQLRVQKDLIKEIPQ